jgi:hypothetical protein
VVVCTLYCTFLANSRFDATKIELALPRYAHHELFLKTWVYYCFDSSCTFFLSTLPQPHTYVQYYTLCALIAANKWRLFTVGCSCDTTIKAVPVFHSIFFRIFRFP